MGCQDGTRQDRTGVLDWPKRGIQIFIAKAACLLCLCSRSAISTGPCTMEQDQECWAFLTYALDAQHGI